MGRFQVGFTRDFKTPDGKLTYRDMGLGVLDADPSVAYRFFEKHTSPVTADQLRDEVLERGS